MHNATLLVISWSAVVLHAAVGGLALRRATSLPLVPVLNLVVGVCVLAYWVPRWYSYAFKGITWYASDQWIPLYGALVCTLALLSLSGRYGGTAPHWIIFSIDALVLLVAAVFFTFFRMDRMI